MEFISKAKVIRLRSSMNKFLTADKDEETVRLSSNSSSHLACWTVEFVDDFTHRIRLKSAHGLYLTVTEETVLIGVNNRKVIQAEFNSRALIDNPTVQWELINEGVYVKLRCKAGGMFLKGNGGVPPWRNTVTCALPQSDTWILWGVDIVEPDGGPVHSGSSLHNMSTASFSSMEKDLIMSNEDAETAVSDGTKTLRKFSSLSPIRALRRKQRGGSSVSMDMDSTPSMASRATFMFARTFKGSSKALGDTDSPRKAGSSSSFSMINAFKKKEHQSAGDTSSSRSLMSESGSSESNLELFRNAKTVRLRSQHNKYLLANEDKEDVHLGRQGSSKSARWNVEFVEGTNLIRLRSCYKKYLTSTEETVLFGRTGKKVMQTIPEKLDSSVQWEPFREGLRVKLKTQHGNFLRGNGGPPPWRNTITHDLPQKTASQDWILWDVEILEIIIKEDVELENEDEEQIQESEYESEKTPSKTNSTASDYDIDMPYSSESEYEVPLPSENSSRLEVSRSFQNEGRLIYYSVVKNIAEVDNMLEDSSINFKGKGLEELKEILAEKSGIHNFILCCRNALNGQLYPIKLQLPPNQTKMHVFLIP